MVEIHTNKTLTHRCDFCHYKSKRCDRLIPQCTECSKRRLKCGIYRNTKYSKKLYHLESSINKFSVNIRKKDANKDNKDDKEKSGKAITTTTILYKQGVNSINAAIIVLFLLPSNASRLNLMTILQFPSIETPNNGLKLMVSLATQSLSSFKKIQLENKKNKNNELSNNINSIFYTPEVIKILKLAISKFIQYDLILITFLNIRNFNFSNFSLRVQYSILVCGLVKLPPSDLIIKIQAHYLSKLYEIFKYPFRLKPNLDNLQALLILFSNVTNFSMILKSAFYLLNFIIETNTILGLNIPRRGINKELQLKRQKLYNFSMFIVANYLLNIRLIYYPIDEYPKQYRISYLLLKEEEGGLLNFNKRIQTLNSNQRLDLYLTIFNDLITDISLTLFQLTIYKDKISTKITTFNLLENELINLNIKFKLITLRYFKLFSKFQLSEISIYNLNILKVYKSYIKVFLNYLIFFTLSLKFYHGLSFDDINASGSKSKLLSMLTESNNENKDNYLTLTIQTSILTIQHACTLDLNYINRYIIPILSQCLLFLIRNRTNNDILDINTSLNNGLNLLKTLKDFPFNSLLAKKNLDLLEVANKLV